MIKKAVVTKDAAAVAGADAVERSSAAEAFWRPVRLAANLLGLAHLTDGRTAASPRRTNTRPLVALKAAGCTRVFVDQASGTLAARPRLGPSWTQ